MKLIMCLLSKATPSDLAGNILGGGDHEFNFDTKGGDNGPANALCSDLPSSEVQTYVDVYFSEPVDTRYQSYSALLSSMM
jgi:hypothetical protein